MKKIIKIILILIIFLIILLFLLRLFSLRELDDLHPDISCDKELIEKSDILWIIPLYNNNSINNYPKWLDRIKRYNKTLGMHGIEHSYKELSIDRDEIYFNSGIKEFEKAFGYKPKIFKPSHLAINSENKKLLEGKGFKVYGNWHQLTHKVYHCSDTGKSPNWVIGIF